MMEFWFEFGSTYSYPTALRIEKVCLEAQVELRWRPFLLGPIFSSQGWSDSPFNIYPTKGRYMWRDLERVCGGLDIPFKQPSVFPRNGLLPARIACWFESESWVPEFVRQVFVANFASDQDISDIDTLGDVLRSLSLPMSILTEAESPEAKLKLRTQTERAKTLGIFGAPNFTIGNELFWGNDRLEAAVAWAKRSAESAV